MERRARTPMKFNKYRTMTPGLFPEFGAIFMSNTDTKEECFEKMLFGLPYPYAEFVQRVKAGMVLFLFEYEQRKLYGVFEAASDGEINIVPSAYSSTAKCFPAQVQVNRIWNCLPLYEREFHEAIIDNYFSAKKFNFGLSYNQVHQLLLLFNARKIRPLKDLSSGGPTDFRVLQTRSLHFEGKTAGSQLGDILAEVDSSHLTTTSSVYSERPLLTDGFPPDSENAETAHTVLSESPRVTCSSSSRASQNLCDVETQSASALESQSVQLCHHAEDNNGCSCNDLGDFIPLSFHDDTGSPQHGKESTSALHIDECSLDPYSTIISGVNISASKNHLSASDLHDNPHHAINLSSAIFPLRIMADCRLKEDNHDLKPLLSCQKDSGSNDSDNIPHVEGDFIPLSVYDGTGSPEHGKESMSTLHANEFSLDPYGTTISGVNISKSTNPLFTSDPHKDPHLSVNLSSSSIYPLRIMAGDQLKDSHHLKPLLSCQKDNSSDDPVKISHVKGLQSDIPTSSKKGSVFSRLSKGHVQGESNIPQAVKSVEDIMETLLQKQDFWMKTVKNETPMKADEIKDLKRSSVFLRLGKPSETSELCGLSKRSSEGQWAKPLKKKGKPAK